MTLRECAEFLAAGGSLVSTASGLELRLEHYLKLAQASEYNECYTQLRAERAITDTEKKALIDAVNHALLFGRNLEWGNHGIRRSFRFWVDAEKKEYLQRALEIVDTLTRNFTPLVTFGFGSVLGMIRDNDFIPHDDDMDLLIALPRSEDASFARAKFEIGKVLLDEGYRVPENNMPTHHTVARGAWAGTDIFIGFVDPDERVSWYPSRRGGLRMSEVFPTRTFELFGVECPIPAQPERYLEVTYGEDWRSPIPNWNHPWDPSEYQDLLKPASSSRAERTVKIPAGMTKRLMELASQTAPLNDVMFADLRRALTDQAATLPIPLAEQLMETASRAPDVIADSNNMLFAEVRRMIDETKRGAD